MFWGCSSGRAPPRIQTFRLKPMEEHGLVTRHCSDHSPRAVYAFTDKGKEPRRVSAHWPRGVHAEDRQPLRPQR